MIVREKIYKPRQLIKLLGKSRSAIYRYLQDGTIEAEIVDGSYIIYQSALDKYIEEQSKETEKSQSETD